MKTMRVVILLSLTLVLHSQAQEARYFRMAGPVTTTITGFSAEGYLTWTNEATNATFTVQMATSLAGASNWVDYVQMPVTNGINTNRLIDLNPPAGMALIPAGSFTMGDTFGEGWSEELPTHTVYVSAFYLDKYEVTKALWDEVYQWATNRPVEVRYSFEYGARGKTNNHPAQYMTWYEAVKWCNARSEKEGRTPAYYTDAGQTVVYRAGQNDLNNNWVKWDKGYRLPTEAEWEKAARGGVSGHRFPWSDTDEITHSRANYYSSSSYAYDTSPTRGFHTNFNTGGRPFTSPAGYFAPNGYGVYDMAGNVWEWCWDLWDDGWYNNAQATLNDTRGPVSSPYSYPYRGLRGGSWFGYAGYGRCADRYGYGDPVSRDSYVGFRCVLAGGSAP